ncbi:MAG: hypothetical protein CM1200mP2_33350 [Planctomycetaceae bacterium]|nr:MAG: hypothetical protein CM1200mP2_33350 [Planctomycetaceae bacterium]
MGHRNALFQVQAEDQRLVAHGLHQLPHEFGAGHGLEPGDDRLDSPFDEVTGSIDVTETRVDHQPMPGPGQPFYLVPRGLVVLDCVKVGEVDAVEAQLAGEGVGDLERIGRVGQPAGDRLV